jgi:uncharacterized protein (DUF2252 family)
MSKNISFADGQTITYSERIAAGKALRSIASRASHANWKPAKDRVNPMDLLEESNRTRLPALVPLRCERMSISPFTFLRGSAIIMAADLARTPATGIKVQVCGDAHVGNFGIYATPERNQVFDMNDFDETLPGAWEWDVKRFATSVMVAGRVNGFSDADCMQVAYSGVQSYHRHMWNLGGLRYIEAWYTHIYVEDTLRHIHPNTRAYINREVAKARRRTSSQVFPKMTAENSGQYSIKDDPPLITHDYDDEFIASLPVLLEQYKESLSDDRRVLLSRYHLVDIAQKVVGIGSVGTRCYVMLFLGDDAADPLFLQIKEARPSVLEAHFGASRYPNSGQRVVNGQKLMQGVSDIFLGWTRSGPHDYYIRQLRDMSLSPSIDGMSVNDLVTYASFCGWVLARAHARSGDAAMISGYMGKSDAFEKAVASFAKAYADQTERDFELFVSTLRAGK